MENDRKICSACGEGVITDRHGENRFAVSLKDESSPERSTGICDEALKALLHG